MKSVTVPEPEAQEVQQLKAADEVLDNEVRTVETTDSTAGAGSCSDSKVAEMVAADNVARAKLGINMLECDDQVSNAAYEWSKEMCK